MPDDDTEFVTGSHFQLLFGIKNQHPNRLLSLGPSQNIAQGFALSRDTGLGAGLGRSHSLPTESMRRLTPDEHETNLKIEHTSPFHLRQLWRREVEFVAIRESVVAICQFNQAHEKPHSRL